MIYLIRCNATGLVKIGFTSSDSADTRLRALQTGAPGKLEILATLEGGPDRERAFHDFFADARVRGEWFSFDDATLRALVSLGGGKLADHPLLRTRPRSAKESLEEERREHAREVRDMRYRRTARAIGLEELAHTEIATFLDYVRDSVYRQPGAAHGFAFRVWDAVARAASDELHRIEASIEANERARLARRDGEPA